MGDHFGAASLTALRIWSNFEVNGLDQQCFLADSSGFSFFQLFWVPNIHCYLHAPTFSGYNNSVLAMLVWQRNKGSFQELI